MKLLSFEEWSLLESSTPTFKSYYLSNRPNHVYRRAGKDSRGNINWQFQEKGASNKLAWEEVKNPESIKALTAQYQANLKKQTQSTQPKSEKNENTKGSRDYWTLITVMACENFPDNKQGMADVAQSIYNRYNIPGKKYGTTIAEIILSPGQYEPVTLGGSVWRNITSKEGAINAYMKTKGTTKEAATKAINNAITAQKDPTLVSNAKSHVGSRTEFLANSPTSKNAASPVERSPASQNNSFFWNYAGKTDFYKAKKLSAQSKPSSVNIA